MKIFIIFAGLMVNVNHPWTWLNTMVMPQAGGSHVAELVIPIVMLAESQQVSAGEIENGHAVIALDGARVSVEGTRGYKSPKTSSFRAAVPSLRGHGSKCSKVKADIRKRKTNAGFSFFDYKGGTALTTHTYLKDELAFGATGSASQCWNCGVRWEADLRGAEATIVIEKDGSSERRIRIKGGAELLVRNAPTNTNSSYSHFRHLYEIYSDCAGGPIPRKETPCHYKDICDKHAYDWTGTGAYSRWPAVDCTVSGEP